MKQILLSATLLFISLGLSAQSNFKPGYYINAKNDTVKGLIDQREKFYNPKTFYFKATPGATIQNITPANANAVGITGYNYYEKHITTISNGSTSLNQLSNRPDTTFVTDTVFLRIIKKGRNVSLYAYTDGIKTRYYILEDIDNKAVELKYSAFLSDETRNVVDVNIFRQQLQILAQKYQPNSPNLVNRINTAVYDESPLSQITSLLNGGNDNSKYEVKSLETSRFFIGAGVKNSTMTFAGQNFVFPNGGSKSAIAPTISAGVDFILNKETQKIVLRAELSVTSAKYNIDNINTTGNSVDQAISSDDFTQLTATLHPQIIYNIVSGNAFRVYVDAGFTINYASYGSYSYTTVTTYSPTSIVTTKKDKYPVFQPTFFSIPLKVGVVVSNTVDLYAAYWNSGTLTAYQSSSASVTAYQVGINFLFGGK